MIRTKGMYMLGIGFWTGAGIYSLINLLINLKVIPHQNIILYNSIISGVAVIGLILNITLLIRKNLKDSQ